MSEIIETIKIENAPFPKKVRRMLGLNIDTWNIIIIISIAITAAAAVLAGLATYAVIRLQKMEAADAAAEFSRYKAGVAAQVAERLPRRISAEQRKVLVELLSSNKIAKGPVLINSAIDGEAWQFGDDISSVLKEAGFAPSEVPFGQRAIAFSKPGTFIWIKDRKNPPKHGGPIAVAFSRVGIKLVGEEHPSNDDVPDIDTVVIAVSAHP